MDHISLKMNRLKQFHLMEIFGLCKFALWKCELTAAVRVIFLPSGLCWISNIRQLYNNISAINPSPLMPLQLCISNYVVLILEIFSASSTETDLVICSIVVIWLLCAVITLKSINMNDLIVSRPLKCGSCSASLHFLTLLQFKLPYFCLDSMHEEIKMGNIVTN